MLKLRRNINQTPQGAPPSCESPRILPLAPCVPPEDVPPTRIHRTARDGAQSVKPMAHPGAPLRGGCASPLCIVCNLARKRRPPERNVCRRKETCEPVFFSREREHNRRDAGGDGRTAGRWENVPNFIETRVYGFFRRRYAHNICTTCNDQCKYILHAVKRSERCGR